MQTPSGSLQLAQPPSPLAQALVAAPPLWGRLTRKHSTIRARRRRPNRGRLGIRGLRYASDIPAGVAHRIVPNTVEVKHTRRQRRGHFTPEELVALKTPGGADKIKRPFCYRYEGQFSRTKGPADYIEERAGYMQRIKDAILGAFGVTP